MRRWLPLALVLLIGSTLDVSAQTASLVRDIDPGPPDPLAHPSSDPSGLQAVGGRVFFSADTTSLGTEPWASDGTAAGTTLLADVCPGECGADLQPVGTAGGLLLFAATVPGGGAPALWRTDGTRAGTFLLTGGAAALQLSQTSDRHFFATAVGNLLYLAACTAPDFQQCGLWRSDGSQPGTRFVAAPANGIGTMTTFHGRPFFLAGGTQAHPGLWTSDGTAGGTVQVAALPAHADSLVATADRLFFFVVQFPSAQPVQLWTSDGTRAGTVRLASFPPYHDPNRRIFRAIGNRLYFVADDGVHGAEIWASDGTPGGTLRITDLAPSDPFGDAFASRLLPSQLEALGNRLLFVVSDVQANRLYQTDGTPGSTAPVGDVSPLETSPLVRVGSRLVFAGFDRARGDGAWSTDGTTAGTQPLCRDHCGEILLPPQPLFGAAFFIAGDLSAGLTTSVWKSDGTPAGTRRFTDVDIGNPHPANRELAAAGGRVFFPGYDGHGQELWVSDGRSGGTHLVADLSADGANASPESLAGLGDQLFFTACDGRSSEVWASGGTAASTLPLTALGAPCYSNRPTALTAAGNSLFFFAPTISGPALWKTDGTPGGSQSVLALAGLLGPLVPYRGEVLFLRQAGNDGQVWTSDGTTAGTRALLTVSGLRLPRNLAAIDDAIYLDGLGATAPCELWKSDVTGATPALLLTADLCDLPLRHVHAGSATVVLAPDGLWATDGTVGAGTLRRIADFNEDQDDPPSDLVELQGKAYFFAEDEAGSRSLWTSDGTPAGTLPVKPFPRLSSDTPPDPAQLTVLGGRLYFVERDDAHGNELWTSNGTPEGTVLVADVAPGPGSAAITSLTAAAGRLFFAAADGVHGNELWTSDGTAAGTHLVEDLAPGPASSAPRELHAVGDRLYWSADDGLQGRELWSLSLAGPAGCQPSDTHLCLSANRFQVEIAWTDFQGHTGVGHAVPLTADTGTFWFFDPANVETVVKVLDARALNGAFWVFYGALSSVEYTMTVIDTQTGLTRRYQNPSGQLASVGDTHGFGPLGAFDTKAAVVQAKPGPDPQVSARTEPAAATGSCSPGPQQLCLNGGRFAVTAAWKDFQGNTGTGTAVALTGDTGYFWFFASTNVEVVLKVLDGRGLNGKFWVFYGALSSVEYTLTVTDTQTGAVKTYKNASGQFASVADTGAF